MLFTVKSPIQTVADLCLPGDEEGGILNPFMVGSGAFKAAR